MPLIVEDGTGKPDANSFAARADATAFWALRPGGEAWSALGEAEQDKALVLATDYVADAGHYEYSGAKRTYAQALPWPRTGACERDGQAIPDDVVPRGVRHAVCYLAAKVASRELFPVLVRGGRIASRTVGPITTVYAQDAPARDVFAAVDAYLAPLLRDRGALGITLWSGSTTPPAFRYGMHLAPGLDPEQE
ncbi:MAG TPA: DnaT-like ssDNA-binding protein [Azospirillum sp.]